MQSTRHAKEAKKEINSNMMKESYGDIDRISHLPEHIIHHILSMLFTKDIVRMSVLSKTWQSIWASFPNFNFDQTLFGKDVSSIKNQEPEIQEKKRGLFMKFVDDTLQRFQKQHISIRRFKLVMALCDIKYADRIDHWIKLATKDNVLELLDINILAPTGDPLYSLPRFTSAVKSLAILRLNGCKLEHSSFDDIPKFYSLHEMYLVHIYADEQIIKDLILCCPSIENFTLRTCWGIKVLKIPHLPKLKKVEVDQDGRDLFRIERVEIKAPNLKSFHYNGWNMACKINIAECENMRELTLINAPISAHFLEDLISKFHSLKALDLQGCNKLKRVVITSPRLERLSLECIYTLVEAKIYAPELNSFVYSSDFKPSVFSINSLRPPKATVDLSIKGHVNTLSFLKLREFIGKFSTNQVLYLRFRTSTVTFNVEELRDIKTQPQDLKCLTIQKMCSSNYEALVDGLFWITHPKTLAILSGHFSYELIKSLCEKLMNREVKQHCCSSTHIKCWRHDLKVVKVMVYARPKRTYTSDCKDLLESLRTLEKWSEVHFELKW